MRRITIFVNKEDADLGRKAIAEITNNPCDEDTFNVEMDNGTFVCDFVIDEKEIPKVKKCFENVKSVKIIISNDKTERVEEGIDGISADTSCRWESVKSRLNTKEVWSDNPK